jgi:hypothetical protein
MAHLSQQKAFDGFEISATVPLARRLSESYTNHRKCMKSVARQSRYGRKLF